MDADTGEENPEHYQEYLEQKMAETLEQVEGVGKVSVMITLKSSEQKIIEKDEQNTSQAVTEEDSEGGVRSTADESYGETSIYVQDEMCIRDRDIFMLMIQRRKSPPCSACPTL